MTRFENEHTPGNTENLSDYFCFDAREAAKRYGMSYPAFRKLYERNGIDKWPYKTYRALVDHKRNNPRCNYEGMLGQLKRNPQMNIDQLRDWERQSEAASVLALHPMLNDDPEPTDSQPPACLPVLYPAHPHPLEFQHCFSSVFSIHSALFSRCEIWNQYPITSETAEETFMPDQEEPQDACNNVIDLTLDPVCTAPEPHPANNKPLQVTYILTSGSLIETSSSKVHKTTTNSYTTFQWKISDPLRSSSTSVRNVGSQPSDRLHQSS